MEIKLRSRKTKTDIAKNLDLLADKKVMGKFDIKEIGGTHGRRVRIRTGGF